MYKLLVLVLLVGSANAEVTYLSFKGKPGESCFWFKESFDRNGIVGEREGPKPYIVCKIYSDESVTCLVTDHNLDKFPSTLRFAGNVSVDEDEDIIVKAAGSVLSMRAVCNTDRGCFKFYMWNRAAQVGFGCDTVNYIKKPDKPAPPPPSLLNKNAKPYKAEPNPLVF
jgi:hypothetical protein